MSMLPNIVSAEPNKPSGFRRSYERKQALDCSIGMIRDAFQLRLGVLFLGNCQAYKEFYA